VILSAAPESPWGFPTEAFRHRAEAATASEPSPLDRRALEALPAGGTVLDVGVGGGATSLPLAGRASHITGVDNSAAMLEEFALAAAAAGVDARTVFGAWPAIAERAEAAHVVVSGHVLYNVPDLPAFAASLTDHARERVVVEITSTHPLAWMRDLWRTLHGIERPLGPTADDAEGVLRELGLDVGREDRSVERHRGGFKRREDAIALVRRRLCLAADRDDEVARALGDRLLAEDGLWSAGPPTYAIATMWWPGAA
jgi:precorrin-6B methylase 2